MTRARSRVIALAAASGLLMSIVAAIMLPVGALTLFRARRLYARIAAMLCRAILWLYGVRIRVFNERGFPPSQTVYISNHTSTLDIFLLVAMGLPNCRFFLSGFLRRLVPLGIISWMMGTFFTVPQAFPEERRRIFTRAGRVLKRTGESVYLSPEGGRITDGTIGPFNKGAFHLATVLRAPIVPMYFHIPSSVDPGRGLDARPGTVEIYVLPPIHTTAWSEAEVVANKERVRDVLVRAHQEMRCA
ncbi:MAG TPA: lysophospholipid acyltransferase family protein [Vicinamibacterales bacterium]|nr:lysophospholipid acyltransferase family protein [Vicinamibacterales bacterium]